MSELCASSIGQVFLSGALFEDGQGVCRIAASLNVDLQLLALSRSKLVVELSLERDAWIADNMFEDEAWYWT